MKIVFFSVIIISMGASVGLAIFSSEENMESSSSEILLAESFIQEHLMNDDGRIRTNLISQQNVYLSETRNSIFNARIFSGNISCYDIKLCV